MTQVLSARVEEDLAAWVAEYSALRGVSRQALVATALQSFRADCEAGVPEIRERARQQAYTAQREQGVGECAKNKTGHVWETVDGERRCKFCKLAGRAFLAEFGAQRAEFFSRLRPSMTSGSGKRG